MSTRDLYPEEGTRVIQAFDLINGNGGHTYYDDAEADDGLTVVNALNNISHALGDARMLVIYNRYLEYGTNAADGAVMSVWINVQQGLITASQGTERGPAMERSRAAFARLEATVDAPHHTEPQHPAANVKADPTPTGIIPSPQGIPWQQILELVKMVGPGLVAWAQDFFTGQNSVDLWGRMPIAANTDRVVIYLDQADDQVQMWLDGKLIAARSVDEKGDGVWTYSDPLKPGPHMLVMSAQNSGAWDWSYHVIVGRQSDYRPGGSKQPFLNKANSGSDGAVAFTRNYILQIDAR